MPENIKAAFVSAIVPAVVTAMGAIVLAVYQQRSQSHELAIESGRAAASASAQALQTEQAIRDQNKRDQITFMHDLAPRVVGTTGSSANCTLVMGLWESAYPASPAPVLTSACPSVPPPPPQHWMVSAGTDPSPKVACSLAAQAGATALPEPRVFERPVNGKTEYVTTIGDYAAKSDAEPIAAAARARLRFYSSVVLNAGWKAYSCP
ncbi:MAG TPA: hypothetical protein VIF09_28300 [Polyangiaceae bacterium]